MNLSAWLLQHPAAHFAPVWAVGALVMVRESGWKPRLSALVLSLGAVVSAGAAVDVYLLHAPFVDVYGVTWQGAWSLLIALVLLTVRRQHVRVGLASTLPLAVLGWLGGAPLIAGVVVMATAMLEPGQAARLPLGAGLLTLAAATWMEQADFNLWLWLSSVGLGGDLGSLFIVVATALVAMVGHGLLVAALVLRTRGSRSASPSAGRW